MPPPVASLTVGRFVETKSHREAIQRCLQASEEGAMMTVYGDPGLGKTISLGHFVTSVTRATFFTAPVHPTVKTTAEGLFACLTGSEIHDTAYEVELMIRQEMARPEPSLVCVDEAQRFGVDEFEFLRSLHDDPRLNFALIFVANPRAWQVIARHDCLKDRMRYVYQMRSPGVREMLRLLPDFHDIYADIAPDLAIYLYQRTRRGNLRRLATFTKEILLIMNRHNIKRLDGEVIQAAEERIGHNEEAKGKRKRGGRDEEDPEDEEG